MKPSIGREPNGSGFQSNNLWVGSLTTDTTESDLADLFGRFGEIDRITAFSSRSFAFIYYRRVEEAVAAKEALQGADLNGSLIKIEFARPVCSHLCVTFGFNCSLFLKFDGLLMVRSILGILTLDSTDFDGKLYACFVREIVIYLVLVVTVPIKFITHVHACVVADFKFGPTKFRHPSKRFQCHRLIKFPSKRLLCARVFAKTTL